MKKMYVRALRRRKPTLLYFLDKIWTIFKNRKFPRHKPLKNHMEAYRCWCAAWTSNPVIAANPRDGGFDSHTLPPPFFKKLARQAKRTQRCAATSGWAMCLFCA